MSKLSKNMKMIILDLDDTLYDCSGTLVVRGRREVAKSLARKIGCSEEDAYLLQLETEEAFGTKINIYEKIAERYNLPPSCAESLLREFIHVGIKNITLFPDTVEILLQLKVQGYILILVTSGEKQIQEEKIKRLGLNEGYFNEIIITDRNDGQTKKDTFRDLMKRYKVEPCKIVCVGDKIEDELTAGRSLGMVTVLFEHGRHYHEYVKRGEAPIRPDHSIKQLKELLQLL